MNKNFSLLNDPWLPINRSPGAKKELVSLQQVWEENWKIYDIDANPFLWTAIQRLLCGIYIKGEPSDYNWDLYSPDCFLQAHFEAADDCGTTTAQYLAFADDNAVAWSPKCKECGTDYGAAQALVQAYFSDRQGIKNSVKSALKAGSSGAGLPHIGKTSLFKTADNLGGFLIRNCAGLSEEVGDFLLYPWRQIQVRSPDQIIIAAGLPYKGEIKDPWVVKSASLKDIREGVEPIEGYEGEYWQVSISVMQARVLGCDRSLVTLQEPEASEEGKGKKSRKKKDLQESEVLSPG